MMLALLIGGRYTLSFEEYFPGVGGHCLLRRDSTATVVAGGQGMDKLLFVNGVGITSMTTITKYMTHLPLLCLGREPGAHLVICLGMGTSYRSGLSWGRDTKVVELVPSVKALLTFFHPDLAGRAKADDIVVDDGRRYLERIPDRYDAIIIDPPNLAPVDHEFVMVQSELYTAPTGEVASMDKMLAEQWDGVVFNGYPNQYLTNGQIVPVGAGYADLTNGRFWVDRTNKVLYVYLQDGSAPTGHTIEASTRLACLFTGNWTLVRKLKIRHSNTVAHTYQGWPAVAIRNYSRIEDCDIQWTDFCGLSLGTCATALCCNLSNNGDTGAGFGNCSNTAIIGV